MGALVGIVVTSLDGISPRGTEQLWIVIFYLPSGEQFQARVYSEDGEIRPISAVLEIPRGPSTVAVRNIGQVPREGRDWRESERICCARPCGESASMRCGPLWGADGIPDGRVGDGRVRDGAVW